MSDLLHGALISVLALPVLVPAAWVGLRLLGVRRGWAANVVAGVAGMVVGWGVTLALAGGDVGDSDVLRDLIGASVLATMFFAVVTDLLAKPGSLARGDEAGLVVVHNPLAGLRRRVASTRRTREILRVASDNGFGPALGGRQARHARRDVIDRQPTATRVRQALEQCGGMFIKLGQVASTRSDLLPTSMIEELSRLQDEIAVVPPERMRPMIEHELGAPVDEVFADFDWEPKAAASIGQVYFATLRSGEPVVIKAQRPDVAEQVEIDTQILLSLARRLQRSTPVGAQYHVADLAREFVNDLAAELDFRQEARETIEIGDALQPGDQVRAPHLYERFTTRRLLVQERFSGVSVRDATDLTHRGVDPEALADDLLHVALRQMLVEGHFHADLHPGNLFVLDDGELGMIDFGSTGRLDPITLASLRQMIVAVVARDAALLRQSVGEVCDIGEDVDDAALERALARFMSVHLAPGAAIDGAVLSDLLQMLTTFGIRVPAELTTFARALVVLEGTLQTISPGYQLADKAQAFAGELVADAPVGGDPDEILQRELIAMLPTLRELPRHADRIATMAEKGRLSIRISPFADPHDVDVVTRLVNRVVVAFLAVFAGLAGALLLAAEPSGPTMGDLTVGQVMGGVMVFGSAVLGLRVLAGVARDGLT